MSIVSSRLTDRDASAVWPFFSRSSVPDGTGTAKALYQGTGEHCASALYQGPTLEVAEKPEFFEGDGLQAVHNCFAVNAALAAEGTIFSQSRLFPQPVESGR
jgi:hypothetical protein